MAQDPRALLDFNDSLLELTPDGIFFLDAQGRLLRSNAACSRLLEYTADELKTMAFGQIVAKRHLGLAKSIFERTMAGRPQRSELLVESKSHRVIAVEVQTVPHQVDGQILGVIGNARDLDRVRNMEQALGDSENLLRLVMQLAHLGRWVWDEKRHEIQPSPELFELMGWDKEIAEPIDVKSFISSIVLDDRERVESALRSAIADQSSMSVQFRLPRGSEGVRVLLAMAEPRLDANNGFLGLIGMVQDITEVSRLSESQQQLAAIVEHSRDLVIIVDVNGRIRYLNRTSRLVLGFDETETINDLKLSDMHHERSGGMEEELQTAKEQGVWRGDLWLMHRDGHAVPVSAVLQCHYDEQKRPKFFSGIARDVSHERALEQHIRYQADHDTLTGLLNRARFTERLSRHLQSRALGTQTTVGFIDLNDFKQINDVQGHTVGDRLLAEVANRLAKHFSEAEILARWGGDEFTFWLPECGIDEAMAWLESLIPDLERSYVINETPFECIPAVGLAIFPDDGKDVETLVRKADAAMFEAKRRGSAYLFHTEAMADAANRRKETREAIRRAVREQEFMAFFQPVIAADSYALRGAEALVRWNHPSRGILLPGEFMAEAERSALIVPLGIKMLELVGQAMATWDQRGFSPIQIAINFSARQLAQDNLALKVHQFCDSHGVNPHWIECEITETAILENYDLARRTLDDFRQYGFRVLLDDFGTGYSSLSHLRDLPIDGIKLDRSFVEQLPDRPRETAIARSTIRLAHDLDLQVTAEGVETAQQAEFLTQEGCDFLQGYGISHPLDAESFILWRQAYHPHPIA